MKTYYHVTPLTNWDSIQKKGLIPIQGERSIELCEPKAIFLFPSIVDMQTALSQWLGEWFDDKELELGHPIKLISLKVTVPDTFNVEDGNVDYEKLTFQPIPAHYITFRQEE